ncbi:hypothetical protein [Streptomyces spinosisporus]|uniref:Lipoprotein n=1 Tax=Streptomyces spinosisporus TaxID=2927582 RepID=A0ABS9XKI2_9ACTN|nr:hypothetical protein [Streptomyces spinosisporus]MCI3242565.1 hypothetical protein [Streptomyces spinosisporus]
MKFPHVLATALALTALLAGCSSQHSSSPGTGSSASPGPGEGEITPSTTAGAAAPSATAAHGLDDWPPRPATADELPRSIRSTAVAKGYTGSSYLDMLTKQWHIRMSPRKKNDFNKKDDVPPVWYASGSGHPSAGSKMSIAVVWNLSGDLESLTCIADRAAPGHTDFLRACLELDHPSAKPASAAAWFKGALPSLDKAFEKTRKQMASPLYRSGRVVSYLLEYSNGKEGTACTARVLGTSA